MTSSCPNSDNCRLERLGEGGRRHVDRRVSTALTLGRLLEGNGRLADIEVSAVLPAGIELPSGPLDQGGVMRSGPASECLHAILGETAMRHGYSLVMVDMLAPAW